MNSCFGGFGRMYGRFLYLFPDEATEQLRKWNASFAKDVLLAEINDASFHNATAHPPLLNYEIWMPGCYGRLPAQQQLMCQDIIVKISSGHTLPILIHSYTNQRIIPVDLGIEALEFRSELYKLLRCFGPNVPDMHPFVTAARKKLQTRNKRRDYDISTHCSNGEYNIEPEKVACFNKNIS